VSDESFTTSASKKKLHAARPDRDSTPRVETQRTVVRRRPEPCGPADIERGVRQRLADKVSSAMLGAWLLVPEHLRLGTWDLLLGWSRREGARVEPRLALQLVGEAAFCVTGVRRARALIQTGFELANGLPFLATDQAVHKLLDRHTVADSQALQVALGRLRRASGHYVGQVLAIDPHRMRSYSKAHMRRRKAKGESAAYKMAQTFFCLDVETCQPLAFTTATASRTGSQAAPELLRMAADILAPDQSAPLVLADTEHISGDLFDHVKQHTPFDLLAPAPRRKALHREIEALADGTFTRHWAGFATATRPYRFTNGRHEHWQLIQREGERDGEHRFKAFHATRCDEAVEALTRDYPRRWRVEEFFNTHQALGWRRAGTTNLHIRYGQMTMALIAQTALEQLRRRLGPPIQSWEASHLATQLLAGLDGDVRVRDDTILVTYYNAPDAQRLRRHYEGLPGKLAREGVDPRIPWLYDYRLDFRFK
jgi:hypothetical protein